MTITAEVEGCPAEFEVCYRPEEALKLLEHFLALSRYSREAWVRCGIK